MRESSSGRHPKTGDDYSNSTGVETSLMIHELNIRIRPVLIWRPRYHENCCIVDRFSRLRIITRHTATASAAAPKASSLSAEREYKRFD